MPIDLIAYYVAYLAAGVFAVAVLARIVKWSSMPMHLRWELYPVAHEEPERVKYGGSYLEESDWWTKPRRTSLAGEIKAMVPEILFLVALKENNAKLWRRSFPFHLVLYLLAACTVLMLSSAVVAAVAPSALGGSLGSLLGEAIRVFGVAGLVLGVLGAVGLLHRRLTASELRGYTSLSDVLNLLFFVVAFGFALVTFAAVDTDFSRATHFVHNLVVFRLASLPGQGAEVVMPAVSVILLAVLLAYIPLTHMSHFVGKYYAYHAIRWNDAPNLGAAKEQRAIQALLTQPVSWAAPHINGDGRKTWLDAATEDTSQWENR
jgi:nitrate reductase gamma subunit